ncbi:lytic transglycosylase domain-containing protein, partial [Aeromonas salmonicida]
MLMGLIPLFSPPGWGRTPPPAEVVILTAETQAPLHIPKAAPAPGVSPSPVSAPAPAPAKITQPSGTRQIQVYKSVQKNGVVRYSDMMPDQGHYELLLFNDCYAC